MKCDKCSNVATSHVHITAESGDPVWDANLCPEHQADIRSMYSGLGRKSALAHDEVTYWAFAPERHSDGEPHHYVPKREGSITARDWKDGKQVHYQEPLFVQQCACGASYRWGLALLPS